MATSVTRMSRPDYEPPNAAEQLTALTDAIARTVHYAHAVSAGFDCPFSELPDDRKAYLFRLAQMVIGLADTDKAEDARSLLTVAFAHAVDGILRDIHHQWEDHSSAEFLQQRFDQV